MLPFLLFQKVCDFLSGFVSLTTDEGSELLRRKKHYIGGFLKLWLGTSTKLGYSALSESSELTGFYSLFIFCVAQRTSQLVAHGRCTINTVEFLF